MRTQKVSGEPTGYDELQLATASLHSAPLPSEQTWLLISMDQIDPSVELGSGSKYGFSTKSAMDDERQSTSITTALGGARDRSRSRRRV